MGSRFECWNCGGDFWWDDVFGVIGKVGFLGQKTLLVVRWINWHQICVGFALGGIYFSIAEFSCFQSVKFVYQISKMNLKEPENGAGLEQWYPLDCLNSWKMFSMQEKS